MKAKIYNHSEWVSETDPVKLKDRYIDILNKANFGVLDIIEHHFEPYGYSLLVLLSESHLGIHTFPEEGKTYLELSSCVKKPFDKFIGLIKR